MAPKRKAPAAGSPGALASAAHEAAANDDEEGDMGVIAKRARIETSAGGAAPAAAPEASTPQEELTNDVLQQSGISEQDEVMQALPVVLDTGIDMSKYDRSEEQRALLVNLEAVAHRVSRLAAQYGIKECNAAVFEGVAIAVQQRLRVIAESLRVIRDHRIDDVARRPQFAAVLKSHPRKQLTLLERHAKEVARIREEKDDAEQAKNRDKVAKEKLMRKREAEEEQMKTSRVNVTTAQFLNMPQKSWMTMDGSGPAASPTSPAPPGSPRPGSIATRLGGRPGTTSEAARISLRDMIHFMEVEPSTRRSQRLYRALLRQGS